jgi:hypothetical protein
MFMPTGGQFMGQRPVSVQPMMQNYQGFPNFREAMGQPTFCAFMPTENAQFPGYYEQTTTTTPVSVKPNGSWNRKKGDDDDDDGRDERNCKFCKFSAKDSKFSILILLQTILTHTIFHHNMILSMPHIQVKYST